jgi:mitochondria-eating protein
MVADVISNLNKNIRISLPPGVNYTIISSFIRESCRVAWQMSCLAYPLDVTFAIDGELIDDHKYRRSYDSDYSAPLVNHHIWPCLMQGTRILSKGEACTRRSSHISRSLASSPIRGILRSSRSPSPLRRSRFFY